MEIDDLLLLCIAHRQKVLEHERSILIDRRTGKRRTGPHGKNQRGSRPPACVPLCQMAGTSAGGTLHWPFIVECGLVGCEAEPTAHIYRLFWDVWNETAYERFYKSKYLWDKWIFPHLYIHIQSGTYTLFYEWKPWALWKRETTLLKTKKSGVESPSCLLVNSQMCFLIFQSEGDETSASYHFNNVHYFVMVQGLPRS